MNRTRIFFLNYTSYTSYIYVPPIAAKKIITERTQKSRSIKSSDSKFLIRIQIKLFQNTKKTLTMVKLQVVHSSVCFLLLASFNFLTNKRIIFLWSNKKV